MSIMPIIYLFFWTFEVSKTAVGRRWEKTLHKTINVIKKEYNETAWILTQSI